MAMRRKFGIHDADKQLLTSSVKTEPEKTTLENMQVTSAMEKSTVSTLLEKINEPVKNSAFITKFVKREKLKFSEDNDYPMENIEKLANEILELGLIHNIETYYDEDNDIYIVNAGERRTRAIDYLIERFKDYKDTNSLEYKLYLKNVQPFLITGYPCKVVYPEQERDVYENISDSDYAEISRLKKHIRQTVSNESGREPDQARRRRKIESLSQDYEKLNKIISKKERVNINKEIAKELNLSDRQVLKYKAVSKLIPELQKKFDEKKITLSDSANYAQLTEEEQRQILLLIDDGGDKKEINALYEKLNDMKNEISRQEIQIKTIEKEKETAQKQIDFLLSEKESLQNALEEESKKEMPQKEIIAELKKNLIDANEKLLESENLAKQTALLHAEQIKELEKKLAERKNADVSPENILTVKIVTQIEHCISNIFSQTKDLKKAIQEYKKIFNEDTQYEKNISDIKKQLENILAKL